MTASQFTKLQKTLDLSDAELAEHLGVDRKSVWRWRTGEVRIERITELAMRYLQASANPELMQWARTISEQFQAGSIDDTDRAVDLADLVLELFQTHK